MSDTQQGGSWIRAGEDIYEREKLYEEQTDSAEWREKWAQCDVSLFKARQQLAQITAERDALVAEKTPPICRECGKPEWRQVWEWYCIPCTEARNREHRSVAAEQ